MSTINNPRPGRRSYLPLADRRWTLVPIDKLTVPELRLVKSVAPGMGLGQLERGLSDGDAEAWFAWLLVSMRREDDKVTPTLLEKMIGETPLFELIESVETETLGEATEPDPESSPSPTGSSVNGDGSHDASSGAPTPSSSTLETSGPRISPTLT